MKKFFLLLALFVLGSNAAEARQHHYRHQTMRHVVHPRLALAMPRVHVARVATPRYYAVDPGCNIIFPCEGVVAHPRGERVVRAAGFGSAMQVYRPAFAVLIPKPRVRMAVQRLPTPRATRSRVVSNFGSPSNSVVNAASSIGRAVSQIVPNPPGCPPTNFCGCGAKHYLFGDSSPTLIYNGRKLNAWWAPDWMAFPRAAPAPKMVAVSSHHIFVLLEDRGGGNWLTYDANSGGHATRIHVRSIAGYSIHNPLVAS